MNQRPAPSLCPSSRSKWGPSRPNRYLCSSSTAIAPERPGIDRHSVRSGSGRQVDLSLPGLSQDLRNSEAFGSLYLIFQKKQKTEFRKLSSVYKPSHSPRVGAFTPAPFPEQLLPPGEASSVPEFPPRSEAKLPTASAAQWARALNSSSKFPFQ